MNWQSTSHNTSVLTLTIIFILFLTSALHWRYGLHLFVLSACPNDIYINNAGVGSLPNMWGCRHLRPHRYTTNININTTHTHRLESTTNQDTCPEQQVKNVEE